MSCHVTSILSTFYPSMWLNSDWVSEVCTLFSPGKCPVSIRSSWGGVRSGEPVLPFQVSPSRYTQSWADLEAVSAHPQGCPKYLVKCPGTLEVTHFGACCRFTSFQIKVLKDFFVLVIYNFFSSLNLLICLLSQLHFLRQLQCYFVFPKALPLAFLSLVCFAQGIILWQLLFSYVTLW